MTIPLICLGPDSVDRVAECIGDMEPLTQSERALIAAVRDVNKAATWERMARLNRVLARATGRRPIGQGSGIGAVRVQG